MSFTPQQMAGGQRYSRKTRIGNWFEESVLDDCRLVVQTNVSSTHDRKMTLCTKPVRRINIESRQTTSARDKEMIYLNLSEKTLQQTTLDGMLRYGQPLSLFHNFTKGTLACDPLELIVDSDSTTKHYATSVCKSKHPVVRNTFVLLPVVDEYSYLYRKECDSSSDIVRWGDPFQIVFCPNHHLLQNRLYLASRMKSEHCMSAFSNEQITYMTENDASHDNQWKAHAPKKSKQYIVAAKGTPILMGESLILMHCATQNLLSSDPKFCVHTDFGSEYEVFACAKLSSRKASMLINEVDGMQPSICKEEPIIWSAVCLPSLNVGDNDIFSQELVATTANGILAKVRDILRQKNFLSLRMLQRSLINEALNDGSQYLDRKKAKQQFCHAGVCLNDELFELVFNAFEEGHSDKINVIQFVEDLRGMWSPEREAMCSKVFDTLLDKNCDVECTQETIANVCNVLEISEQDLVKLDIIPLWDQSKDFDVTKRAFLDFHRDVSALIEPDDLFETTTNNMWPYDINIEI